jgi:predicted kinase
MKKPKLIILYGFASSGKTTLAKKYIDEHPLAIALEGDPIVSMMGQWRKYETEARELVFEHTKSIIKNHTKAGYDVLLPYLLANPTHAEIFEQLACKNDLSFYEIYLDIKKEEAIERLLERGVWGEEDSPKLTIDDVEEITNLYTTMEKTMSTRNNVTSITCKKGAIKETYQNLLEAIS